jgi:hypothetical protein
VRFYYPRALVRFTALVQLSRTSEELRTVTDVARPRAVTIERNDYNTADTCEVELDVQRLPILPRMIRQVLIQVYVGDAGGMLTTPEDLQDDDSLIRFIGYVDEPEMALSEDEGKITWKARDYTGLYLDARHPHPSLVPSYGDTLDVALRRVLNAVPGGAHIDLELQGLQKWPDLGTAAPRALKDAKMGVKPEDTLWHYVKRACDPVAMIPRIVLDKLVVGTSRGLRAPRRRPVFVYGHNLTDYKEKRNLVRLKEGIGLNAYDVTQQKYITAVYPPHGDVRVTKPKKHATKRHQAPPPVPGSEDKRQWFPYGSVAGEDALEDAAERLFNERNRQEFEGEFKIARMAVESDPAAEDLSDDPADDDASYDVTGLENGDRVFIQIDSEHRQLMAGLTATEERVQLLIDVGYSERVAPLLVESFESGADGPLEVYVHKATHKVDEDGYELTVKFQNLVTLGAA